MPALNRLSLTEDASLNNEVSVNNGKNIYLVCFEISMKQF